MNRSELLELLAKSPLVASVQASPGSPMQDPTVLTACAKASLQEGVGLLRLEGVQSIRAVMEATGAPAIGLIKRAYPNSQVYITPTRTEVDALLELGTPIIALDATPRERPGGEMLADLVQRIHAGGALAMGDCDDMATLDHALSCGFDLVGTTLAGYTSARRATAGPDLELLREFVRRAAVPVIAEGRYANAADVMAALRIGAQAVVVGGAINDPVKQTRALLDGTRRASGPVGAVDIGGTWLRFGIFDPERGLREEQTVELPEEADVRMRWIRDRLDWSGLNRVGISTGGTVDPRSGAVVESKALIPGNQRTRFRWEGIEAFAINDGLATAWGHACHADYAGQRVLTLALGTGIGAGLCDGMRLDMGRVGGYPRLNDLQAFLGQTFEEVLGGKALGIHPTAAQREAAGQACRQLIQTAVELYHPEVVVLAGGVGLSDWLRVQLEEFRPRGARLRRTPYGVQAGLIGAGWLAYTPPINWPAERA